MIERPNNWNEVQEFSERPKLPVDAYVCKIRQTSIIENNYGKQLAVLFDIEEGDYKNFFTKDYTSNTREDKKWKGVLRLFLPKNDGSEKDEWTKSTLKGFVTSVEKSNIGYSWNWDETSLKGKMVGILFRNEEWENDSGKTGWSARPFRAMIVEHVRAGEYTIPAEKALKPKNMEPTFETLGPGYGEGNPFEGNYKQGSFDDGELPF